MSDNVGAHHLERLRARLCVLGTWPKELGEPLSPEALDLYAALEGPYRAAGRPYGDSLTGLVRWWREG
jgi:hypothetical protein